MKKVSKAIRNVGTYTFDEQENWIERTQNIYLSSVLGKEEKSTIMERKITYYQN
ncbi:hypothetical protein ACILDU_04270 [Capnocytophaga canimorsus]|uniref:hypothetical protein n=1 Tax=Capnocytophaga canimorsus TaxID=28188 RepID=UPI0037D86D95